jgi:hypothetical protein
VSNLLRPRPLLSDDARRRRAVHAAHPQRTALPLAAAPAAPERVQAQADPATNRAQAGPSSAQEPPPVEAERERPWSAEQIADLVYELLRQDLRLDRERFSFRR